MTFSDPPPPPPPPLGPTPPPLPPPAWTPDLNSPARPVESVKGLATAIRALFWVVTALTVVLAFAALHRKQVWEDFQSGDRSLAGVDRIDHADHLVNGTAIFVFLAQLAVLILLCIWSIRATRNANTRHRAGANSGLAGGGWFIPAANAIVPFVQLRKAMTAARLALSDLNLWQATLIAAAVTSTIGRVLGNFDSVDVTDVSGRLSGQVVVFFISAVAFALAAFFGGKAVMQLSRAEEPAQA